MKKLVSILMAAMLLVSFLGFLGCKPKPKEEAPAAPTAPAENAPAPAENAPAAK